MTKYLFVAMVLAAGCNSEYITYQEKFAECIDNELLAQGVWQTTYADGPLYWHQDSFPLRVHVSETVGPVAEHAIQVAATEWNKALGFDALSPTRVTLWDVNHDIKSHEWDVITVRRYSDHQISTSDQLAGGYAASHFSTTGVMSQVNISYMDESYRAKHDIAGDETLYNLAGLFLHEFGHALGLDHNRPQEANEQHYPAGLVDLVGDEAKKSPMIGSQPFGEWEFEERDLKYIRLQKEGYCPNETTTNSTTN